MLTNKIKTLCLKFIILKSIVFSKFFKRCLGWKLDKLDFLAYT